MTKELALPTRIDYASLDAIYAEIKEARGEDVILDGSSVKHFGSSGLQLLLSAHRSWDRDGFRFSVANPSEKFSEHLEMLGLNPDFFSKAEAEQ